MRDLVDTVGPGSAEVQEVDVNLGMLHGLAFLSRV